MGTVGVVSVDFIFIDVDVSSLYSTYDTGLIFT